MIVDGYTWTASIGGVRVAYRPVLRDERAALLELYGERKDAWQRWIMDRLNTTWNSAAEVQAVLSRHDQDERGVVGVLLGVLPPNTAAPWTPDWETASAANLMDGLRLLRDHPGFAKRSCEMCQKWRMHDDGTLVTLMSGKPIPRSPEEELLCETFEGCPKGTPQSPRTLWPCNRLAFHHFRVCSATGRFPDDPLVARNAILIRQVLEETRNVASRVG